MLVLSRRRDETICIGNSTRVTVVDIRGDKVRLGIQAPRSVPVHREEIALAIASGDPQPDDAAIYAGVLEACIGLARPDGLKRPRLPAVSLERMLTAHAAQDDPHRVTCEPRLIALAYVLEKWDTTVLLDALDNRLLKPALLGYGRLTNGEASKTGSIAKRAAFQRKDEDLARNPNG